MSIRTDRDLTDVQMLAHLKFCINYSWEALVDGGPAASMEPLEVVTKSGACAGEVSAAATSILAKESEELSNVLVNPTVRCFPWLIHDSLRIPEKRLAVQRVLCTWLSALRHQQVRLPEINRLGCAITATQLQAIHCLQVKELSTMLPDHWAFGCLRILLHAVLTIAFVGFLRVEEVLMLHVNALHHGYDKVLQQEYITITVPYGIHQGKRTIYKFPDDVAHLCPVRALGRWMALSGIDVGYIFPSFSKKMLQQPSTVPLSPRIFITLLRNLMMDIGVTNVDLYGGNSMRRGGVLWAQDGLGWSLERIMKWGRWGGQQEMIGRYLDEHDQNEAELF
ncbi:hypothetical protein BDZ89DRAFT_1146034 [Hymenopellis radicata]|nr:hypothetical protein BDZ89DRAFT_1146034 [Hymenopellis radicata]